MIGRDPFDIEQLAGPLRYYVGGRAVSSIEIALVGSRGQGSAAARLQTLGREEGRRSCLREHDSALDARRARPNGFATQIREGWKAIKLRLHYPTLREDIELVTAVRKAVGDGMEIMTDANQAQSATGWQPGVVWDFRRALETARELEKLNVYWLEEPLRRYDWDGWQS